MRIPVFQIDAFTDRLFAGNPAAVCVLESWLPEVTLQAIAAEMNLSETAFVVPDGEAWELRWFTPRVEVDLCGHATLAAGKVCLDRLRPGAERARFRTRSGEVAVGRKGELLELDFPALAAEPGETPEELAAAVGGAPREARRSSLAWLLVYGTEAEVRELEPDVARLGELELPEAIVTAPGIEADFVSRFFAPAAGIDEDPVTGSAHCVLTPYWAEETGRALLRARQLSRRGGELLCELRGERVGIAGGAVTFLEGEIIL